ncbi:ion channel [Massilia sp. CMS3.1]|uniref:ion channel n=1 Tax=Massilia sp. CMS3.1 TaxID=3373083 RepID=UPI003EE78D11
MHLLRMIVHTRRHPSAILLLAQLLGMVLYPFLEQTRYGHVAFNAFGIVILAFTVRMVQRTPGHTWICVAMSLPIIALLTAQMLFDMPYLQLWSSAIEALFYFYAAGSLISYMLADRRVTTDELYAAGATFTLLAWGFAHLYMAVQALTPHSFGAAVNPELARTWTELNYLSFALLSSTGIGDVIPLTGHARSLASIEMFVGLMYLAAVVARLIGLTMQPSKPVE